MTEAMFSNWRGKIVRAAERGDRHLAFMSLESLNEMLHEMPLVAMHWEHRFNNMVNRYNAIS